MCAPNAAKRAINAKNVRSELNTALRDGVSAQGGPIGGARTHSCAERRGRFLISGSGPPIGQ